MHLGQLWNLIALVAVAVAAPARPVARGLKKNLLFEIHG